MGQNGKRKTATVKKNHSAVIISLHPEWWELYKRREKLLEIRKTRPQGSGPYTVFVYITGGVGVVGEFTCDCFYEIDTRQMPVWVLPQKKDREPYNLEKASCLTRQQLMEYAIRRLDLEDKESTIRSRLRLGMPPDEAFRF